MTSNGTKCILVTGGAGYIGTHCIVELVNAGYETVIVDNLVNATCEAVERVEEITGRKLTFYKCDLLNKNEIEDVFQKHHFYAVLHLAGLKAVGESVEKPLLYYGNNITGSLNLFEAMLRHGCNKMVFSSSATVYGTPQRLPIGEDQLPDSNSITNPYGKTKWMLEEILRDMSRAHKWDCVMLRYFNPVGSHPCGRIGEDPRGPPNNLMPYVSQVAVGKRPFLRIFGNDYDTPDGTGVRDYIHVCDLATGHVAALKKLDEKPGVKVYNLGTGTGYSVLEMVRALEKASGKTVPYEIVGRREGDIASVYGDPTLAQKELGWTASRGLDEMCEDLWRWQCNNPDGFQSS